MMEEFKETFNLATTSNPEVDNTKISEKGGSCQMVDETKEVFVEAVFQIENQRQKKLLEEMEIFPEEGQVILSRKFANGRWMNKINGESVTVKQLQKVSESLIDIYGQHQQQILRLF